jgi:Lrp/AsnC family transcriptional regulator
MARPAPLDLDEIDYAILDVLQRDASLSNAELASKVGLSSSPCWRRIKRLEDAGVIARRVALLDPVALGLETVVFASIKLAAHSRDALPLFEAAVLRFPEVMECYTVSGGVDYLLKVVTRDIRGYEQFLRDHLLQMPAVAEVHSRIAITEVKRATALPLRSLR